MKSRRLKFPLGLYRVEGSSMAPTLRSGQLLVGWRWAGVRTGRVVVARRGRLLVKRVARVEPIGLWLLGDNPAASTDSRQFGYLPPAWVEAVVVWPRGRRVAA